MRVRAYRDGDWNEWLRMSMALFPSRAEEHVADMRRHLARVDAAVFVAERPGGTLAGFVEVGARPYADGCDTAPVGYVEAWYVDADVRRQGYGRALLDAAESWARGRGYREMASDAALDNVTSHAAHRRAGYEEVDRVVQFRKALPAGAREEAVARRGEYRVSCDPADVDVDAVHAFLATSYWAEGIPRELVARAVAGSIPVSLFHGKRQVGFARAISDRATYAYLADVYVLETHRGRGLGKWLIETLLAHPDLQGLRRLGLVTRDAHGLYRPFGFGALATPDRHMEIARPGLYRSAGG